jgi:hypothetical protein
MRALLLSLILISSSSIAQVKDANIWFGYGLKMDITKKFDVSMESQARFYRNASTFSQYYNEASLGYRIVKGVDIGLDYRYSRKYNGDYYYNQNRISLGASYKFKLDMGLDFKVKSRYQFNFNRLSVVNGISPEYRHMFRQAFSIDYKHPNFKLLAPFIATEFFFALSPTNTTSSVDSYRIKVGVDIDLPKRQTIGVFYMYEHENRSLDNINHIYGAQYNYEFKRLNKGKKKTKAD